MIPSPLRAEVRSTIELALPAILTQLGLNFMSNVDSIIVGRVVGEAALGGVGLGNSIFFGVTLFALGTIMALDPLIAQAFGAGDRRRCALLLSQGVWLALAMSVPLVILFLDVSWLLRFLDQEPEIAAEATAYLRGRAWNVPTLLLFGALRGFLNGVGNTRAVMVVVLVANLVNGAAVLVLVTGAGGLFPPLGSAGAGYGTALTGVYMMLALLRVIRSPLYADFDLRRHALDLATVGRIVRFGAPIGATITAEVGVFTAAFLVMGQLGRTAAAAHNVALTLASMTFMVPLGIGIAASIRIGQAIGRGAPADAARTGFIAYVLGVGFMVLSAIVLAIVPGPLARIYAKEPEVVALAITLIRIAALFQISDGAQAVGAGCLRGAGDSRTALIVNLAAHWGVGFPVGLALAYPAGLGATGMWLGLTTSLTLVGVILAFRFRSGRWRVLAPVSGSPPTA